MVAQQLDVHPSRWRPDEIGIGAATAFRTHRKSLAADPVLGPLADERDRMFRVEERFADCGEDPPYLDVEAHLRGLAACGFRRVEVPWRELDLEKLVAVR